MELRRIVSSVHLAFDYPRYYSLNPNCSIADALMSSHVAEVAAEFAVAFPPSNGTDAAYKSLRKPNKRTAASRVPREGDAVRWNIVAQEVSEEPP